MGRPTGEGSLRKLMTVLLVALLSLLGSTASQAQELTGWDRVLSTRDYDFSVSLVGGVHREGPIRLYLGKMLVRNTADARSSLIADRSGIGLPIVGYDRYASTTFIVAVDCATESVQITKASDFDNTGQLLEERDSHTGWRTPAASPDPKGMTAAVERVC